MKTIEIGKEVIDFLKSKPVINLNILGYIENTPKAKAVVFGDLSRGVIITADFEQTYMDCTDEQFLGEFFDSLPKGAVRVGGAEMSVANAVRSVLSVRPEFSIDYTSRCSGFVLDQNEFIKSDAKGYECFDLTAGDAEEVDKYYTYRSDISILRVLDNITKRPSVGIKIDGELAAWSNVHSDNSMGMLFVKEKFRGRGLGRIIGEALIERLLQKGQTPFLHIVDGNTPSFNVIKTIPAMKFTHTVDFLGLMKN